MKKIILHFLGLKAKADDRMVHLKTESSTMHTLFRYAVIGMERDDFTVKETVIDDYRKIRNFLEDTVYGTSLYAPPHKSIKRPSKQEFHLHDPGEEK